MTAENGTERTYTLAVTVCPGEEKEILGMFHDQTQGDMWEENSGWNTEEDLNNWHGVQTQDGKVSVLALPDNRLSGEAPEALKCLGGLEKLGELDLSGNSDLEGALPQELENLDNLRVLDIRCTEITVSGETEQWAMGLEDFRRGCGTGSEDMVSEGGGGCAVGGSQDRVGASALLAVILMLLALSRGLRACSY